MSTVWQESVGISDQTYTDVSSHLLFPITASTAVITGVGSQQPDGVLGKIDVFAGVEGQKLEKATIKKDGAIVKCMEWHPTKKILASGWSNGQIALWNDSEQSFREAIGHRSAITCLAWSPKGQRLLTADADGEVIVWRCDVRGRLTSLCQYRMNTTVTHCIFRPDPNSKLDDPRSPESPTFFLGSSNGSVHYADDMGHCSECVKPGVAVLSILIMEISDTLILVNEDLLLSQHVLGSDGKLQQTIEFKLSATVNVPKNEIQIKWVGPGILALCSGSKAIRIWDLSNDESYNLTTSENSRLMVFAYNHQKNLLVASSDQGTIYIWKRRFITNAGEKTITWDRVAHISVPKPMTRMSWAAYGTYIIAQNETGLSFFSQHQICYRIVGKTICIQLSSNKILLYRGSKKRVIELDSALKVKALALTTEHLCIATGTSIESYHYSSDLDSIELLGSFNTNSSVVYLDGNNVIVGYPRRIDICNFQGAVKNSIKVEDSEGELVHLDECNKCLIYATTRNILRLFDISRREPRILTTRKIDEPYMSYLPLQSIVSIKCNYGGSFISIMGYVKHSDDVTVMENRIALFLYNINDDRFSTVDFGPGCSPVSHNWDIQDPRIIMCEVESYIEKEVTSVRDSIQALNDKHREIVTTFVTPEHGVLEKDRMASHDPSLTLLGVSMPYLFYFKKPEDSAESSLLDSVQKVIAKDFQGIDEVDTHTVRAMIDFSFFLMLGDMDDAFKAIQAIKNRAVWEHLAKICVKSNRLDVAAHCLSHMGYAHAIKAMRQASREPEPEVRRAILAAYLGLTTEAEELLISCNRYDVLSRLYEAGGQWEKALEISGSKDRINLKTTYHKFGKYLSDIGDLSGAVAAYEKSQAFSFEVPRMLLMQNGELEEYINSSDDKSLKKWWAQFAESQGDYSTALKYYEMADDILSLVRVHCYSGKLNLAIDIYQKSKNPAAAYHIARHFEGEKMISEALTFYSHAKCFRHAIKLAKESKMENELMHLALQGNKDCMIDVAKYYELSTKNAEKAISLYFKAGSVAKAVDLCFWNNHFAVLGDYVDQLDKNTDPAILQKCADHFLTHGQYDKAVPLLVKSGDYIRALDLCIEKSVTLTEEMANEMTADMGNQEEEINSLQSKADKNLILKIADCCLQQRSFHLACKKYIQAGERIKAIKALLQSGDTEKIIFFATALGTKQKEIFVMVANYLQTLDWRNDPAVMKAIIAFYTKAKAIESLAGFYEACSQIEIDEYQNYEKGLSALQEAMKCISKSKSINEKEYKIRALTRKMELIEKFVAARERCRSNDPIWIDLCESLLNEPDVEDALRTGDIFAMMIEKSVTAKSFDKAAELLTRMRKQISEGSIEYYLDQKIVQQVDAKAGNQRKRHPTDEINEEIG